jgi:hypothetical protein
VSKTVIASAEDLAIGLSSKPTALLGAARVFSHRTPFVGHRSFI